MSLDASVFRLRHRLRVRWAEVDMQKIVFNGHYLMYFDTAMADYWRALCLPYEAAMQSLGGDLYVKKASVEYHGSAQYDDRLEVCLRCARIGNSSMVFEGAIYRQDALLITGELVYVFADPASQTSKPVPAPLRGIIERFEAGQGMFQVQSGSWDALGEAIGALRQRVFVQEQGIDHNLVSDAADATAQHVLAINGLGQCIAAGRLLQQAPGTGKIGRMAVDRVLRGARLGSAVLQALVEVSRLRGDKQVVLQAQRNAQGFYGAHGFDPLGEPYDEAGVSHIDMALALKP
jgi:YbgC/YbaW family acyl-CoA thioester hydrolase